MGQEIIDISYFSGADRFTLSTWFKVDSSDDGVNNRDIISKGSTTAGTTSFFIRKGKNTNLNKISLSFNEGTINVPGTTQLQNNVWYHLTVVYKGYESNNADRAKIYINGVDDTGSYTNTVPTTLVSSTQPLRIGRWASGTDFYGNIDETAIWQSVLTDAQILQVYNNGRPSDITSLSPNYWWRLGENAYFDNNSFIVPNSITGAPNGTGSGTITTMISADAPGTYSQSYNMIPSDISPYVPQYVGNQIANNFSMSFDSASSTYFNAGNSITQLYNGAFTISYWVKQSNLTGNQHHIMIPYNQAGWSNPYSRLMTRVTSSGSLEFRLNTFQNLLSTAAGAITSGNWHHICCTFDGTTNANGMKIYIDAGSPVTKTSPVSSITSTTNDLFLGTRYSGGANEGLNGQIDEVAIFDTALNAGQIFNDLYQPTATATNQTADIANNPNLPTPVAWYRMGD
jgi:hypothetical protein